MHSASIKSRFEDKTIKSLQSQFAYTETVPILRIFPIPRDFQPRLSTETHALLIRILSIGTVSVES